MTHFLAMTIFSPEHAQTNPAMPLAILGYAGVVCRKLVAAFAVRLPQIHGSGRIAAPHVFPRRNRLKVIRADAVAVCAATRTNVIEIEAGRDRTDEQFVRESVHENLALAVEEQPVSVVLADVSGPKPAGFGLLDSGPKSDRGVNGAAIDPIRVDARRRAIESLPPANDGRENKERLTALTAGTLNLGRLLEHRILSSTIGRMRVTHAGGDSQSLPGFLLPQLYPIERQVGVVVMPRGANDG